MIWLLTMTLFAALLVFADVQWGRYLIIIICLLLFLLSAFNNEGRIVPGFGAYHLYVLSFAFFTVLSALWAADAGDAISAGETVLLILIATALVYSCYYSQSSIMPIVSAIKWAGVVVAVYTYFFYGRGAILSNLRLYNSFNNINTIGKFCALSCVFTLWCVMNKQSKAVSLLLMLPNLIVIAATQSRTALLILLCGILGTVLLRPRRKNLGKELLMVLIGLLILFALIIIVQKMQLFSGIIRRTSIIFNAFFGRGKVDSSFSLRRRMIQVGLKTWKEHPVLGIGMGNAHMIAGQYLQADTYLHNNYAELLCSGGIVGFALYYSAYVYLAVKLYSLRNIDRDTFSLCLIWIGLMLLADFAGVSFSTKTRYFYLMTVFVAVKQMERKQRESV